MNEIEDVGEQLRELENKKRLLERRKELASLREKAELEKLFPYRHVPMYKWQRDFHESVNRINLITAANQCGKSSALIRRAIADCIDPERWDKLYKGEVPQQIWYFYPDFPTVEREVSTKWMQWLPKNQLDKETGWTLEMLRKLPISITFKSGAKIYFYAYSKKVTSLQASTVNAIYADEELPMDYYDELMFRIFATDGYFNSGFTPTLNQLFWKQAMESQKVLPTAFKQTISMYDCLLYEDGSPSRVMTIEKIKQAESMCKSDVERQRRIYGKFVTEEGRLYFSFSYEAHVQAPKNTSGWFIYAAVDYGSGMDAADSEKKKKKGHPSAIVFIAVNSDYTEGRIVKSWRGDHEKTTAGDLFNKYREMKGKTIITQACYDHSTADFGTIAERNGENFVKADKSRDSGVDLVNTLFKHKMLVIDDDNVENLKLASELMSMMTARQNSDHKGEDDLADALRYGVMMIPWDLSQITKNAQQDENVVLVDRKMTDQELIALQIRQRRGEDVHGESKQENQWAEIDAEFAYWNEQLS